MILAVGSGKPQEASGLVRLIDLYAEIPSTLEFMRKIADPSYLASGWLSRNAFYPGRFDLTSPSRLALSAATAVAEFLGGRSAEKRDTQEIAEIIDQEAKLLEIVSVLEAVREGLVETKGDPRAVHALEERIRMLSDEACDHGECRIGFPPAE
jgi:uncharacterized secreted protein with C-terminal beta-propeller domain